jgi:rhodanese-related sulfurtransferase
MVRLIRNLVFIFLFSTVSASAQYMPITASDVDFSFSFNGKTVTIRREKQPNNQIMDAFVKKLRECPPFCVLPMISAPGVSTIGELEIIDFLQNEVAGGRGLLIDTRIPVMHQAGTIPGSVNVPFSTLASDNPFRDEILMALGARKSGTALDFTGAMELALFCNGPWCSQSSRAIKSLLEAGYPANKLSWYRDGMYMWGLLGLSIDKP